MTGDKSHLGTKTCYQGSLVKQTVAPKNQCIFANNKHVSISYKTYWWYSQFIRAKLYTNKVVIVQRQKWNKSQLCIVCINNLKSRSFPYKYKHPTLQPNQTIWITVITQHFNSHISHNNWHIDLQTHTQTHTGRRRITSLIHCKRFLFTCLFCRLSTPCMNIHVKPWRNKSHPLV